MAGRGGQAAAAGGGGGPRRAAAGAGANPEPYVLTNWLWQGAEGKQLLLEAVAGLGALLLALERRIPGPSRERGVVAHLRRRGGAQVL